MSRLVTYALIAAVVAILLTAVIVTSIRAR